MYTHLLLRHYCVCSAFLAFAGRPRFLFCPIGIVLVWLGALTYYTTCLQSLFFIPFWHVQVLSYTVSRDIPSTIQTLFVDFKKSPKSVQPSCSFLNLSLMYPGFLQSISMSVRSLEFQLLHILHHPLISFSQYFGFFGFFECENNQETANSLFDSAKQWLCERGMDAMRGPANPSMNDECGLLIDGFDSPPVILMTYNPRYYEALFEGYGLGKVKDLHAYILDQNTFVSDKMSRLVDVIRKRSEITIFPAMRAGSII